MVKLPRFEFCNYLLTSTHPNPRLRDPGKNHPTYLKQNSPLWQITGANVTNMSCLTTIPMTVHIYYIFPQIAFA